MDGFVNGGAATAVAPEVSTPPTSPTPPHWPTLRDELRLLPASANADGSPAWMIHDPVVNRFFRIAWLDFELLLRWGLASPPGLVSSVNAQTLLHAEEGDVHQLLLFLRQHSLLKADTAQAVDGLCQRARQLERGALQWLLHNYLFIRLPLLRPQRFLTALSSHLGWVFTRQMALVVLGLSALGLFLAARQLDTFTSSLVDQLSWSGLAGYIVALSFAKALHELAHALTATRHGVRVAHMGVAFLVMFPMLYTDTSESWKLTSARQRLAIASAGIVAELALAGLATLAWSLAPEGAVKSALFFLATTSWVLSLAVNASPFMRFDGYFITMDWLDFPNLHERAGAMARTALRRALLGWRDAYPEQLAGRGNACLVAFALTTWVYRLTVFLGIALLVYHCFFKLLGVALMAVELLWFIGKPVMHEMKIWHARRADVQRSRQWAAGLVGALLLVAAAVPWPSAVHGPGWLHAHQQQLLFAPLAGRLVSLPQAGLVVSGQTLFALTAPELALSGQRAQTQADARAQELLGLAGLPDGEDRRLQVQAQQDKFLAEARLYRGEGARLQLTAAFAGVVTDIDPQLAAGVWVQPRQALATLIDPTRWVVEAFVDEADIARVRPGQSARIYRSGLGFAALHGKVVEVDGQRTQVLPHAMLDAHAGGPVATLGATAQRPADAQAPRDALYRVKIALDAPPATQQTAQAQTLMSPMSTSPMSPMSMSPMSLASMSLTPMSLTRVVISAEGQAWWTGLAQRVAAVFVRESGF
jgi:putative peptide zinc metalloprotease protein